MQLKTNDETFKFTINLRDWVTIENNGTYNINSLSIFAVNCCNEDLFTSIKILFPVFFHLKKHVTVIF